MVCCFFPALPQPCDVVVAFLQRITATRCRVEKWRSLTSPPISFVDMSHVPITSMVMATSMMYLDSSFDHHGLLQSIPNGRHKHSILRKWQCPQHLQRTPPPSWSTGSVDYGLSNSMRGDSLAKENSTNCRFLASPSSFAGKPWL